jgi:DNA polymerase-3 subunit delta'
MKKTEADDLPEADALAGAPHPRHVYSLVGHERAEAEMLVAYREGRLAHAWLIGGKEGIGKATLAWRFARFVLANPDPTAKAVQGALNLHVEPTHSAARLLAGLAHPDFALIRREWQPASKRLATEISVEAVRHGLQVFQLSAAFGGWRVAIVDSAEDLNRNSANALLKMIEEPPHRSLILIISHRQARSCPQSVRAAGGCGSILSARMKSSGRSAAWGRP